MNNSSTERLSSQVLDTLDTISYFCRKRGFCSATNAQLAKARVPKDENKKPIRDPVSEITMTRHVNKLKSAGFIEAERVANERHITLTGKTYDQYCQEVFSAATKAIKALHKQEKSRSVSSSAKAEWNAEIDTLIGEAVSPSVEPVKSLEPHHAACGLPGDDPAHHAANGAGEDVSQRGDSEQASRTSPSVNTIHRDAQEQKRELNYSNNPAVQTLIKAGLCSKYAKKMAPEHPGIFEQVSRNLPSILKDARNPGAKIRSAIDAAIEGAKVWGTAEPEKLTQGKPLKTTEPTGNLDKTGQSTQQKLQGETEWSAFTRQPEERRRPIETEAFNGMSDFFQKKHDPKNPSPLFRIECVKLWKQLHGDILTGSTLPALGDKVETAQATGSTENNSMLTGSKGRRKVGQAASVRFAVVGTGNLPKCEETGQRAGFTTR